MSMPLDVAVDIAGVLANCASSRLPLNIPAMAAEIASRHRSAGYSYQDLAEVLEQERLSVRLPAIGRE